jgi:acetyl-CoA/propionyl-CoA carboxylase biotin carboxyl carrier protein
MPALGDEEEEDLRVFNVEVNSRRFSVRLAEVGGAARPRARVAEKRGAPAKGAKGDGAKPAAKPAPANSIVSPLQGVLSDIRIKPRQKVEEGQVIFIVQAMKMENEITAPKAGIIDEIRVENGASVQTGTVLATYEA